MKRSQLRWSRWAPTAAALAAVLLLSGTAHAADGYGNIKGTFVLEGQAPALPPVVKKGEPVQDAAVCAANGVANQKLVVGPDGGVANVFIYIPKVSEDDIAPDLRKAPKTAVEMDQNGCVFVPHAFVIRVGQELKLLNADPVAHNVHTYPVRGTGVNVLIGKNERMGVPTALDKPEIQPIPIKCDIHNWMEAYALVLDHPYGAVSDKTGTFEIKQLPAGKHTFRIWHETSGYLDRSFDVTVKAGQTTDAGKIPVDVTKLELK